MTRRALSRFAGFVLLIGPGGLHAQVAEVATFYLASGNDTLVMERATRLPNRLTLDLVDTKRLGRVMLSADLATSGLVTAVDARFFASDRDTAPVQHTKARFDGD